MTTLEKSFWGSALVGAATFPTLLGTFQRGLFKPFGLHCAAKYSSLVGLASVGLASYGSSWISLRSFEYLDGKKVNVSFESFIEPEVVSSAVGGLLVFRALGGKFKNVLPSNLLFPGAFANNGVPVGLLQKANSSIRKKMLYIGRRYGCHSCGSRTQSLYIVDHQPPSMVVKQSMNTSGETHLVQQVFPHCVKCSVRQGSACGLLKNGKVPSAPVVTHASSLRFYHAFLPLPASFILAREYLSSAKLSDISHAYEVALSRVAESLPVATEGTSKGSKKESSEPTAASNPISEPKSNPVSVNRRTGNDSREGGNEATPVTWGDFPPAIVWRHIATFLTSLHSPLAAYHLTLWTFIIIAAFGTI